MLQRTDIYMKEQKIDLCGKKIVLGLSGGMDSVCLFHILLNNCYLNNPWSPMSGQAVKCFRLN